MEATVVNEPGAAIFQINFFVKIVKRATLAGLSEVSALPERASGTEKDEESFSFFIAVTRREVPIRTNKTK
jgi:hypothetical protein